MELILHYFKQWHAAWRYQVITQTNADVSLMDPQEQSSAKFEWKYDNRDSITCFENVIFKMVVQNSSITTQTITLRVV